MEGDRSKRNKYGKNRINRINNLEVKYFSVRLQYNHKRISKMSVIQKEDIKIGTVIHDTRFDIKLKVTSIKEKYCKGDATYKKGRVVENILSFSTLSNPHYNQYLKIIE